MKKQLFRRPGRGVRFAGVGGSCSACYRSRLAPGGGRATYEDLIEVPDTMVAEIIDGELYATPHPAFPHADVVVPDLAGWRRERVPRLPSPASFDVRPDWACEVVSPTTATSDRVRAEPFAAVELELARWWLEE